MHYPKCFRQSREIHHLTNEVISIIASPVRIAYPRYPWLSILLLKNPRKTVCFLIHEHDFCSHRTDSIGCVDDDPHYSTLLHVIIKLQRCNGLNKRPLQRNVPIVHLSNKHVTDTLDKHDVADL